uniref:RecQ-mediated genome instability protein 1 n=1 Tax=Cacopsylla melanoneura TaxID=428564 RepID=A0A8D8ZJ06_9HEMI
MNMIDSKIQSTKDFMFSKNIQIDSRNCWMKNCVEWFVGENNHSSLNELHNFVFDQFLLADLRDVQLNCLPTNILEQEKSMLTGKYTLQVDSIQDVSQSCYSQIQTIRGTGKNLNVENQDARSRNHAEGDYSNTRGSHMMKLNMTDGVHQVYGMEYETLSQIRSGFIPGCKVVISGPIEVRRGVFFLKAQNFHLLGGELDSLIIANSVENILARALNLEENPNARPINILADLTNNSSTQNSDFTQTNTQSRPLSNQITINNSVPRHNQPHQNSNSSNSHSNSTTNTYSNSTNNVHSRTDTRTNQQSFPNNNARTRNDIPDRDDIPDFDEWEESSTSNAHGNGTNNPNGNQQSNRNARPRDDIPELDDWEDDEMLNMEVWNTIETSLVSMAPPNPPSSSSTSTSLNTNVSSNNSTSSNLTERSSNNSTAHRLNDIPSTTTSHSSTSSNVLCPPTSSRVNPSSSSSNDVPSTSINASSSSNSGPNVSNPKAPHSNLKRYPSPDLTPPSKRQNTTSYTDSNQSKPSESSLAPPQQSSLPPPPQSSLAPPLSSSPPTRMTLSRIKASPPPTPFSMVFRGCKVKSVEKLSVSKGAWKLPATITDDGVDFLNVDFSDAVIFNISGVSAAELQSKKKQVTTDPELRKSIEEMVQNILSQITNYEGSMKISFTSNQKPTVVALPK